MSQLDLHLGRESRPYVDGDLHEIVTEAQVVTRLCSMTGLLDKTIAVELGVDPAMLSKAQSGMARLTEKQIYRLSCMAKSDLWLHYWMTRFNFDPRSLRTFETKLEADVRVLRERVRELEQREELTIEILRKVRAS